MSGPTPLEFGLGCARLTIDEAANLGDLADDFNCLFGAGLSALEAMSERAGALPPEGLGCWWAMLYTMRQANAVFQRLYAEAQRTGVVTQPGTIGGAQ